MTATKSEPTVEASLGRVIYYLALLLILTPAIDFVANVLPLNFGDLHWRYGTVGLLSGFLMTPILGLLIATLLAYWQSHGGVLQVMGWVDILCGALLFGASALFILDLLQVRSAVPADALATFDLGTIKALVKNLASAFGLGWLGLVTRRLGKSTRAALARPDSGKKLFRAGAST